MILPRSRRGNSLAELLVVLAMVGLGAMLFWPRGEVDVSNYGPDIFIGIVEVLAIAGAIISASVFWRRPLLTLGASALAVIVGSVIGWVAIMHSLWFCAFLGALCAAFVVYLIIYSGRRAEE